MDDVLLYTHNLGIDDTVHGIRSSALHLRLRRRLNYSLCW